MSDLISRQALLERVGEIWTSNWPLKNAVLNEIHNAPPIDPVKHGRWIKQNPMVDTEECSECGYNIPDEDFRTPYCPWCGAKMEGEEDE